MTEHDFILAVQRHLDPGLHVQSMTSASLTTNGTPDRYYDGPAGDLWVEYKQLDSFPRSGLVGRVDVKKGCYSPLQFDWMSRRWRNGRNVLGIVGLPNKTAVIQRTPDEWLNGTHVSIALPYKDIAACIHDFCLSSSVP